MNEVDAGRDRATPASVRQERTQRVYMRGGSRTTRAIVLSARCGKGVGRSHFG
jgi:hypothetical protein